MSQLFPAFLKLHGRRVLVVGGGPVAASKLSALAAAGASITVVAPAVVDEIARAGVQVERRPFRDSDLDGVWFVVAAAPSEVNRAVADAAERRHVFVNAVDDPSSASVYLGGVVRRDGVTVAISTDGRAPAMAGLLREGLDAMLPADLGRWMEHADALRRQWRATGVPMTARRPDLLRALVRLYPEAEAGKSATETTPVASVAIVGAGPGAADLLTIRGARRLADADVVFHDGLVPEAALALSAPFAERVVVSRRPGADRIPPAEAAAMMIAAAQAGRRVVRLRTGDPFVLARGAEELLILVEAGVPFEIVPGLTTASAAATLAGIPLTHRGVASGFVVVSGHAPEAYAPVVGALAPGSATIVVLMGLTERPRLAALLQERGWRPETPVATLVDMSQPSELVWHATLAELAVADLSVPIGASGVVVIGDVVDVGCAIARGMHGQPVAVAAR